AHAAAHSSAAAAHTATAAAHPVATHVACAPALAECQSGRQRAREQNSPEHETSFLPCRIQTIKPRFHEWRIGTQRCYSVRSAMCGSMRDATIGNMKWFAVALAAATSFAAVGDVPKSKTMGNPSAPLHLELYGDFPCPHCKHLHEDILPMIVRDFIATNK